MHTHTHIHACTCTHRHTHRCRYMCACAHTRTHRHVHMHAHPCACIHRCVRARTYMYAHTDMHVHMCTRTCICIHVCTGTRAHTPVHTCTCMYAHTHVHTCVHMCARAYAHAYTCTHMHVHAYVCAHMHAHTCVHIGTQTYLHTCQSGRQSLGHCIPASGGWCAAEAGILCFLPLLPTPRPQSLHTLTSRVFPKRKESHFVSKAPGAFVVLPPLVTVSARKELRGTQRVPCPLSAVISICNSTPSCCLTGRRTPNSCDHLSLQGSDSTVSLSRSIPSGGTEPLRQTSPEQQRSFRAVTGDPNHCPQAPPNPAHLRVPMPT